jgi:hypothetical protein
VKITLNKKRKRLAAKAATAAGRKKSIPFLGRFVS